MALNIYWCEYCCNIIAKENLSFILITRELRTWWKPMWAIEVTQIYSCLILTRRNTRTMSSSGEKIFVLLFLTMKNRKMLIRLILYNFSDVFFLFIFLINRIKNNVCRFILFFGTHEWCFANILFDVSNKAFCVSYQVAANRNEQWNENRINWIFIWFVTMSLYLFDKYQIDWLNSRFCFVNSA